MPRNTIYRNRRPEEVRIIQENVENTNLYLLKEIGPTCFLIQDEAQRNFKVHIGELHMCTCAAQNSTKELCLHICWILLKRFRIDSSNPISWQLGLVEREIMDLLNGKFAKPVRNSDKNTKFVHSESELENGQLKQRIIGPDDLCPICQDELLSEERFPVTYCRTGCGNNVHIKCMRVWTEHQRKQTKIGLSESIPCPICREDFAPLGLLVRESSEAEHSQATPKSKIPAECTTHAKTLAPHSGTCCMECSCSPIVGKLYKCDACAGNIEDGLQAYLCSNCFKTNRHEHHDDFCFKENANSKWIPVMRSKCRPPNLGNILVPKYVVKEKEDGTHKYYQRGGAYDTLRINELSAIQQWTVREPRWPRGGHLSQHVDVKSNASHDKIDGTQARLQNWGHLRCSGLLAPGRQCRICLMAFKVGDVVRRLTPGCQHVFHTACIDPWLLHTSGSCPLDGIPLVLSTPGNSNQVSACSRRIPTILELSSVKLSVNVAKSKSAKLVKDQKDGEIVEQLSKQPNTTLADSLFGVVGSSLLVTSKQSGQKNGTESHNAIQKSCQSLRKS